MRRGEADGPAGRVVARRPRVTVLMTVHDRKALTLRCLEQVEAQRTPEGPEIAVVVVDDGCTDGTPEAIRQRFPGVLVIPGSGQLYWNGGMRRAFLAALEGDPDFYLLLNDDTLLRPGALAALLDTHAAQAPGPGGTCVVVGSTIDPATGRHSYGGWRRTGWLSPMRLERVPPGEAPVQCDTVHGNCVLVPREVVRRIGILDAAYVHSMGDLDYGFRAVSAGIPIWIAPGYLGECTENPGAGLFVERALGVREQWRRILGPKGLPPRAWLVFTRRHAGPLWPLNFAWPYAKIWLRAAWRAVAPARGGRP